MKYWIYFMGTSNGKWIEAENIKSAKWIFAIENNLNSIGYIAGSRKYKVK